MDIAKEALERLAPPPRAVSPPLALNIFCKSQIGCLSWFLLLVGFGLFVSYGGLNGLSSRHDTRDKFRAVEGVVESIEDTVLVFNNRRLSIISFSYTVDGQQHVGTAYGRDTELYEGEPVEVRYSEANPTVARIEGTSPVPFDLFPLVLFAGLAGLWGLFELWRKAHILKRGLYAEAKLLEKVRNSLTINDRRLYKLVFEYTPEGQASPVQFTVRTTSPGVISDESTESILYLPKKPRRAIPLDSLKVNLQVSSSGDFEATRLQWFTVVITVSGIACLVTYLSFYYLL